MHRRVLLLVLIIATAVSASGRTGSRRRRLPSRYERFRNDERRNDERFRNDAGPPQSRRRKSRKRAPAPKKTLTCAACDGAGVLTKYDGKNIPAKIYGQRCFHCDFYDARGYTMKKQFDKGTIPDDMTKVRYNNRGNKINYVRGGRNARSWCEQHKNSGRHKISPWCWRWDGRHESRIMKACCVCNKDGKGKKPGFVLSSSLGDITFFSTSPSKLGRAWKACGTCTGSDEPGYTFLGRRRRLPALTAILADIEDDKSGYGPSSQRPAQ
jgi:hypothetical protein